MTVVDSNAADQEESGCCAYKEHGMRRGSLISSARVAIVVGLLASMSACQNTPQSSQPGKSGAAGTKTAWGEPDLQGIWMDIWETPLQRPDWVANRESFTDAERKALDERRAGKLDRDFRAKRGTVADVSGAYNDVYRTRKHTGPRTSLIVDPPDGKMPPFTQEVQNERKTFREYELMLFQASEACKDHERVCAGGQYLPPSPHFHDVAPIYPVGGVNRSDDPEDQGLIVRCLAGFIPAGGNGPGFSGADPSYNEVRRIVQTPGGITMFYDVGQGQGFQRNIVMNGSPHLPPNVRQWWGDSRGHWEGDTLVVDVTNFNSKVDFYGSRGNMHVIERYRRTSPETLEMTVTMEDPKAWTKPWTVREELTRQSDSENRIYPEPRCHEGNYGMPGLLKGARMEEKAFAQGRGPNPATICQNGCNGVGEDAESSVGDFAPLSAKQ
jgi:hypothetical protein